MTKTISTLKTVLPIVITTRQEAETFLKALHENGEGIHPEDDAHDIIGDPFTFEEAEIVNELMDQISEIEGFDACDFILHLDPDYSMQ